MRTLRFLRSAALALACMLPLAAAAQDAAPALVDIPAGDLVGALRLLAQQSGAELAYREDRLSGLRTTGVHGTMTAEQALQRLLQDSGFTARRDPSGALMIVEGRAAAPARRGERAADPDESAPSARQLDQVTVTGTRIRGGSTPSAVISISAADIEDEGLADLGEVIRKLPQNFSGGQNPGVVDAVGVANFNDTGGSALNLRGLGPDASLTLLNGRRMSYDGMSQAVDISAVPVEAIERIEIVADGASAIYGSDAVGGVANVVLKRDFDGVTLSTRQGGATDGGLRTEEYALTAGAGWSGGGLIATYKDTQADAIVSDQRGYTSQFAYPRTIYPAIDSGSGLVSVHQALGEAAELRVDAFRTQRGQDTFSSFEAFDSRTHTDTVNTLITPGVEFVLPGEWTVSAWASRGRNGTQIASERVAADSGVITPGSRWRYLNHSRTYEVGGEGPLFALGGGAARLAVGAGQRSNDFLYHSYTGITHIEGEERSRFAYAELSLPLIGPDNGVGGVRRLELTAAVRGEDYASFGGVTTPKLGLIYAPGTDFTAKASWGKSFKAPTLYQQNWGQVAYLYPRWLLEGEGYPDDATVLVVGGGGADLKPERARTWSTSLAFHPQALPGLDMQLTGFDIDYAERVVQPVDNLLQALVNPVYADFIVTDPGAQLLAELIAASTFVNASGADYDPDNVVALILNRYVNAASQRLRGIDLSGAYRIDLGEGRLTIRGAASWLDSRQQTSAGRVSYDLAGTLFNPPRFNGRLGVVWSGQRFTGSAFVNYAGGVTDTVAHARTASLTTLDATLRYETDAGSHAWSGMEFMLTAQNLLDRAPPRLVTHSINALPYDSTNYSPIGRFVGLSIAKHW
jgi:iron complex outermembrane receptor protein